MLLDKLATFTCLALARGAAALPSFPKAFYMGELVQVIMNQGGYRSGQSRVCCSARSPGCKVEAETMGNDYYEDAAMNRSRFDSGEGSVVRWYQIASPQFPHDGMEMAITPNAPGSAHKYSCASWCPLSGAAFESEVKLGDPVSGPMGTPVDIGPATITQAPPGRATAQCEQYRWKEGISAPKHHWSVVMSQEDFYVNGSHPAPFFHRTTIEPAGSYLGEQNISFLTFTPMNVTDKFDIDPETMAKCKGGQCDDASALAFTGGRARVRPFLTSYLSLARAAAAKAPAEPTELADGAAEDSASRRLSEFSDLDLPLNYVSVESATTQIAQNALPPTASGDLCCDLEGPGCQVQLASFEGTRYFDWKNQRQRIEDRIANQTVVDDYDAGKSMLVANVSGIETCVEFCPITLEDDMTPLRLPARAKYVGEASVHGKTVGRWQWFDTVFKVVKMQEYDFYAVNQTVPKGTDGCYGGDTTCTLPVFLSSALTPLGQLPPIGYQNTTWHSVALGTPPPAKFKIAGAASCPESKSCGSSTWQAHRLGSRQHHTFLQHLRAMRSHRATMPARHVA